MSTDRIKAVPKRVVEMAKTATGRVASRQMAQRATSDLPHRKPKLRQLRDRRRWLLVVLDACRYDMLAEHFSELFLGRLEGARTNAHDTFEWGQQCWDSAYPGVTYLSGATPICSGSHDGFEEHGLGALYEGWRPAEHIGHIIDVWADDWDPTLGTVPPEAVVDRAIGRLHHDRQLVAHIFQPHAPYIGEEKLLGHHHTADAEPQQGDPVDRPIWDEVADGTISDERLRESYHSNLIRALEAVCWLIRETGDRPTVLMADHGEALGEYEVYAHPRIDHPHINRVPVGRIDRLTQTGREWARRAEERDLDTEPNGQGHSETLEALGYL